MIVNVKDLVSYAIKKQFKISHVPCEVMVFDKDEIPESIKSKIKDQYDEKFLDDSDKVIFFKGPIDKDMVQKLFKAVDKALGEDSNKLVVGDFKLLKVADVDDGFQIGGDEDEEAPEEDGITDEPEEDMPAPTSDDEVTDDEVNDVLDADEANEKAAEDAEDVEQPDAREADEQVEESMDDDRHGLSLDDILKLGNKHAAERNAAIAADKKDQLDRQNQLKRIWVKDIFIDKSNDNNSYADMQLIYADGSTTESRRNISTTGTSSVDDHDPVYTDLEKRGYKIGGERMRNYDKLYREYKD